MKKPISIIALALTACGPIAPETVDTAHEPVTCNPPNPNGCPGGVVPVCPGCDPPETAAQLGAQFGEQTESPGSQQWYSLLSQNGNLTQVVADHTTHFSRVMGLREHLFTRGDGFYLQNLNGQTLLSMSQSANVTNPVNNIAVLVDTFVTTDYEPIGTGNSFVGETAAPQGLQVNPLTSGVAALAPNTGVDGCYLMSIYGGGATFFQGAVFNSGVGWIQSASALNSSNLTFTGVGCYVFQGPTRLSASMNDATPGLASSTSNVDCDTGFDVPVNFGNGTIQPPVSRCIDLGIRDYNGLCYPIARIDDNNWQGDGSMAYVTPGVTKFPNDWVLVETQSGSNIQGPVTTVPRLQVQCQSKAISIP